MSTNSNNEGPMFRVTFSRITGKDEDGNDILGRAKEIGAVWPRRSKDKHGGIIVLDLIPVELTQRQGVLFLVPADRESRSERKDSEGSK